MIKGYVINWDGENRTGAMEWDNGTGTMGRGHWDGDIGTRVWGLGTWEREGMEMGISTWDARTYGTATRERPI